MKLYCAVAVSAARIAATRDAARVLGHDYGVGDRLAKLIPDPEQGRPPTFDRCLRPGEPLRGAYDTDATAKQIVDVARGLEGIVRNASIHAAAVVIAGMPLTDVVPLQLADSGGNGNGNGEKDYRLVTQLSMKPVEELGLLKMDFLGLRNLDVIEDALDIIERSNRQRPDMTSLPLDDEKTYEMMARGDSVGVFQFESRRGSVDLTYWSHRGVKRDCDTRCLACIGVNPVIQPARENYEQSRLRPNPKGLAVWIARSSHCINARPRIQELQNTTERLVCAAGSRIAGRLGVTPRIDRQPAQPGDVQTTWADIASAGRDLHWAPRTGFDDGMDRFIAWFQAERADRSATGSAS
jgi:hypothetical protein